MQMYNMKIDEVTAMHWRRINSPILEACWEHALQQTDNHGKRVLAAIHHRIERWLILQDDLFGLSNDDKGVRVINQMSTNGLLGLASCIIWWQFHEELIRLEAVSSRGIGETQSDDERRSDMYDDIMVAMPEMFDPMDYLMRIGGNPSIGIVSGQLMNASREGDPDHAQGPIEPYARYTVEAYRQFESLYGDMSVWEKLTGIPLRQPMSLTEIQMEYVRTLNKKV